MQTLTATLRWILGALCVAVIACVSKEGLTVWKVEVPSPDGQWIAMADTVQNGGFGSAYVATSVYLRRAGDSRPPVTVLQLSCRGRVPHPYVLDNVANAGGSIHLSMKWLDQSHLKVTYEAHPEVLFQAVRLQNVSINVEDVSGAVDRRQT